MAVDSNVVIVVVVVVVVEAVVVVVVVVVVVGFIRENAVIRVVWRIYNHCPDYVRGHEDRPWLIDRIGRIGAHAGRWE